MFSRRHPYLFFLLLFSTIVASTVVIISLLVFWGTRASEFEFGEKVGIIEVTGYIDDVTPVLAALKRFREAEAIKAIVIRIDSPGGSVGPSQEVYREIRKTIKTKTVIASMGAVAASGGYYIAAAANGIMANPGTLTGSIGVIMGFANFQALMEKIGLYPVVVKSGRYKDTGAPHRKMTDDEKTLLQAFVDNIHQQFVNAICEGRKMDTAQVKSVADGRIFSGETAKELGFVDRLGNLEDAVAWAAEAGGIKGKVATVYAEEQRVPLLRYLINSSMKALNRNLEPTFWGGYQYLPPGS